MGILARRNVLWKFRSLYVCVGLILWWGRAMTNELQELLDAAKKVAMSPEQKEEQRRSFAYGNTKIENPRITRETVDEEADALNEK